MRSTWRACALGDLARIKHGYAFKGEFFGSTGTHVVLTPGNFHEAGGFKEKAEKAKWYSGPVPDEYVLDAGDLIVAMTEQGEGLLGSSALVARSGFYLHNQRLGLVTPASAVAADRRFLYYLFNSRSVRQQIRASANGAKIRHTSPTRIYEVKVRVPDISAQRRIASILAAYDELIENNTRRIAILEEMARRIYEEWFVRFRFPGHESVRMVESELGLVPEGWTVRTLQDIATITMGLSPKGDTYNEDADGTALINGPVEFGERLTKRVKWTTAPTKFCEDGDLVVCVRGSTTGKYVKSDGVYCLGRGVCAIHGKFQGFVDQVFAHQLPTLLGQVGGSTFPSWTGPQLKLHPVLVPTVERLGQFEAYARPMSEAVRLCSRQIENLRTTRDLLLPKLISGELDVSSLPEPQALAA